MPSRYGPNAEHSLGDRVNDALNGAWSAAHEMIVHTSRGIIDREIEHVRCKLESEYQSKIESASAAAEAKLNNIEARESELDASWEKLRAVERDLQAEKYALEEEKSRMAGGTHMTDVLQLSVGGEKTIEIQRGTLCTVDQTFLASSFSGRWDDSLPRNSAGAILVDFEPELFMPLVAYLRAKRIEDPAAPAQLSIVKDRRSDFCAMLQYYGMDHLLSSVPAQMLQFMFQNSDGMRITEKTCKRTNGSFYKRAVGPRISFAGLEAPVYFNIELLNMGTPSHNLQGQVNVGVGEAVSIRHSDESNTRNPAGVWVYSCANGALLAPKTGDILGASERQPSVPGDILQITLFPNRSMALRRNDADLGMIFHNLPDAVKPVVEMNKGSGAIRVV